MSSSLLITEFRKDQHHRLEVDLCAASSDLHHWWPDAQIQRDIKHRFLISSHIESSPVCAKQTLTVNAHSMSLLQQMYWASQLYCGDELMLLHSPTFKDSEHGGSLSVVEEAVNTLWALTCMQRHDDANRALSDLMQVNVRDCPWSIQASRYQAIFKHFMWFKRYSEAMQTASEYLASSLQFNQPIDEDYALLLGFWTECMVGTFQYDQKRISHLKNRLKQRGWRSLYHLVQSSLWFDQVNFAFHQTAQLEAATQALSYYQQDHNAIAISRTHHHMSVMYMRMNEILKADEHIEHAIEGQQAMPLIERRYNALNGFCFFLVHAGRFSEALDAVEKAYMLVIEDGNFEQICTTLFNVAYVAFMTDHHTQCIKLIDDIFSIMLLRGLTRTRFRSNYELKAMQALSNVFRGDVELALAIFENAPFEPQTSLEGRLFVSLLALLSKQPDLSSPALEIELNHLIKEFEEKEKNILLVLLIRKFVHQLSFNNELHLTIDAQDNAKLANQLCEKHNFLTCKKWFISEQARLENRHHQVQFEKFSAIKLARRELQIDLLKVENSLLKAALNFESYARSAQSTEDLLSQFMSGLTKTIKVTFIHLHVEISGAKLFDQRFGFTPTKNGQAHRFPIYALGVEGLLVVSFDPITEVYQHELMDWLDHMVEQLVLNLSRLIDYKKSESLAYRDFLTGLANRAALDRYFSELKRNQPQTLTIGYVDLDNLKSLNDEFGHEVGDRYLTLFTRHLSSSVRDQDRVFRIGGDEFVFMLENLAPTQAEQVASRFQQSFLARLFAEEPLFSPTMALGSSIGLLHVSSAALLQDGKTHLLKLADQLMYQAKQGGGNRLHVGHLEDR